jgi:hypothetical protein
MSLAGQLQRILCPSCMGIQGTNCKRCGGGGYVWKDPYGLTAGEQGLDEHELEPVRPKAVPR